MMKQEAVNAPTESEDVVEATSPKALSQDTAVDSFDRALRASLVSATGGASLWAALQAWEDWAFHLALSPARLASLGIESWASAARVVSAAITQTREFEPAADDRRFRDPAWRRPPYSNYEQSHLAALQLWRTATDALPGAAEHHMRRTRFMGEQILQALSPTNFAWSNPEVAAAALKSAGFCFAQGLSNFLDDAARTMSGRRIWGAEEFEIGKNVAATPGVVVLRNHLMELIQYAPSTDSVKREPILIVPAWIMKYYILDLTRQNSLIRYLVDCGFTVFCISWKNPEPSDRGLTLDAYRTHGVMAALDRIAELIPARQVHGVGYCLGGTMLAIAAATMARDHDPRFKTLTFLAAQTDFSEAGELMMFIDESQVAALEALMSSRGYLDARQMAGAFYALRAHDMLWSRLVQRYLIGEKLRATDLDAWLSDPTRMPARMHSEYLRWLFLENRFAQGNLDIEGGGVSLKDIRTPVFAVGAERDHIAPWRSVHKLALFTAADTTFVLSGGGHNTAIVSPPGKPKAYYRINHGAGCGDFPDPDDWVRKAPLCTGSWWPEWSGWLEAHSSAEPSRPARVTPGAALGAAPGTYVFG